MKIRTEKLEDRLELAAKILKQGEGFQARVKGSGGDLSNWYSCTTPAVSKYVQENWDLYEIRLIPQPVMVPLEVSDVPPGSVIRNYAWNESDWVPVAVGGNFVIRLDTGERLTFEKLMLSWQILRLGERCWEPCMKENK